MDDLTRSGYKTNNTSTEKLTNGQPDGMTNLTVWLSDLKWLENLTFVIGDFLLVFMQSKIFWTD